jgi:arsenite methyltransferase
MASAGAPAPINPADAASVRAAVSDYYGRELKTSADLKTSACCVGGDTAPDVAAAARLLPKQVTDKFYGCGSPLPPALAGVRTLLDLGCGTGRDTFIAAKLMGPGGTAIGVDMTEEQLDVATASEAAAAAAFGHAKPNTMFLLGDIADLRKAGIGDGSVDVVISNCVLNLAASKEAVLREVWRVLAPGGELYFADVYADRRIPPALTADPVLYGECLSGALYTGDFARILRRVGFAAHYVVSSRPLDVGDAALAAKLGPIRFTSDTVRAFKLPAGAADGVGEDFGQSAIYDGSIAGHPHAFALGLGVPPFITGQRTPVDGAAAAALTASRYSRAFRVTPAGPHLGAFGGRGAAGLSVPLDPEPADGGGGGGCCGPAGGGGRGSSCC